MNDKVDDTSTSGQSRQVLLDAFQWIISDIERESSSGTVVQVLGPVVDVEFRGELPSIGNLMRVENRASGLPLETVELLGDGVMRAIALDTTDGLKRNAEYLEPMVEWRDTRDDDRALLCDPQTSGGLLAAVPRDRVANYLSKVEGATEIGEVLERENIAIVVD